MKKIIKPLILLSPILLTSCQYLGIPITKSSAGEVASKIISNTDSFDLEALTKGFTVNVKYKSTIKDNENANIIDAIDFEPESDEQILISYMPNKQALLSKKIISKGKDTKVTENYYLLKDDIFYSLTVSSGRKIGYYVTKQSKTLFDNKIMEIINQTALETTYLYNLINLDSAFIDEFDVRETDYRYYSDNDKSLTIHAESNLVNDYNLVTFSEESLNIFSFEEQFNKTVVYKNNYLESDTSSHTKKYKGMFQKSSFEIKQDMKSERKITWSEYKFSLPKVDQFILNNLE